MKVGELIDALSKLDPESDVRFDFPEYDDGLDRVSTASGYEAKVDQRGEYAVVDVEPELQGETP